MTLLSIAIAHVTQLVDDFADNLTDAVAGDQYGEWVGGAAQNPLVTPAILTQPCQIEFGIERVTGPRHFGTNSLQRCFNSGLGFALRAALYIA
jgi:hypothetical protein